MELLQIKHIMHIAKQQEEYYTTSASYDYQTKA